MIWLLTFSYLEEWEEQEFDCCPPGGTVLPLPYSDVPLPALPTRSSSTSLPPTPSGSTGGLNSRRVFGLPLPMAGSLSLSDSCWEPTSEMAELASSALQASRLWRLKLPPSLILSLCAQVSTGPTLRERSLVWTHALEREPSRYWHHG